MPRTPHESGPSDEDSKFEHAIDVNLFGVLGEVKHMIEGGHDDDRILKAVNETHERFCGCHEDETLTLQNYPALLDIVRILLRDAQHREEECWDMKKVIIALRNFTNTLNKSLVEMQSRVEKQDNEAELAQTISSDILDIREDLEMERLIEAATKRGSMKYKKTKALYESLMRNIVYQNFGHGFVVNNKPLSNNN